MAFLLIEPLACISYKRNEVKTNAQCKDSGSQKAYVAELNTKIAGSLAGVVVAYNGISVADDTKMRKELREAGVEYMVVKNTMLRRAVAGTQYEAIAGVLQG